MEVMLLHAPCLLRLEIPKGTDLSCDVPGQDQGQQGSNPGTGLLWGFCWAATQQSKGEAAPQKNKKGHLSNDQRAASETC